MREAISIRPYGPADADWAIALNRAAVPEVNDHTGETWAALVAAAHAVRVAENENQPQGIMVLFSPGAAYDSPNYRWFNARYPAFLYVDRIIVDTETRGSGIGRALYEEAIGLCRATGVQHLTCEVNLWPPNPGSIAFHKRFGFKTVGRQETEGGAKSVQLMALSIGSA